MISIHKTRIAMTRKKNKQIEISTPGKKRSNDDSNSALAKKQKLSTESLAKTGWNTLEEIAGFNYLESEIDNPQYVFVNKVQVLNHLDEGYGLYAAENIPDKTLLGQYTGELVKEADPNSHYSMEINSNLFCDPTHSGNFTRFINFSEHQDNAEFIKHTKQKLIAVYTTRNINKHEQLLINYNTFDEEAATKYYFLNSDDSWKSSTEYYTDNKKNLILYNINNIFPGLHLQNNDQIYLTPIAITIINKEKLTEKMPSTTIDLRLLKVCKENNTIMDFNKFDTINALILACYFGQADNVNWLLENNVSLNKQQTISGKSALFFAIQGVKDGFCTEQKCINVISSLIDHKANIYIQDNQSEIFLFSAIRHLSSKSIETILEKLIIHKNSFKKIAGYVNENDEDIFYLALNNKQISTFKILLDYAPHYFNEFVGKDKFFTYDDIKDAIKNYNAKELAELKQVLSRKNTDMVLFNTLFDKTTSKQKDNKHYGILEVTNNQHNPRLFGKTAKKYGDEKLGPNTYSKNILSYCNNKY